MQLLVVFFFYQMKVESMYMQTVLTCSEGRSVSIKGLDYVKLYVLSCLKEMQLYGLLAVHHAINTISYALTI